MKRKQIALMMAAAIMLAQTPAKTQAAESLPISQQIISLTNSLKNIIAGEQAVALEEIKSEIRKNGWDYEYTMDSIEFDSILQEADYLEIISSYMTVKNAYRERGELHFDTIKDLNLLQYSVEECTEEVPVPVSIPYYKETQPGIYEETGEHINIIEDQDIDTYEAQGDHFVKVGTTQVVLDKETIVYGKPTFRFMTPEEIFSHYRLDYEAYEKEVLERIDKLTRDTSNDQIAQQITGLLPVKVDQIDLSEEIEDFDSFAKERREIVTIANALTGQVPYLWGGKSSKPGYDNTWWTFNDNNKQKGLDCSGFVEWVYRTAGYDEEILSDLHSTYAMLDSDMEEIPKEELKIGDIGVKIGRKFNHTGIYAGKINGKDHWLHCSSEKGTVVIAEYSFQKYYSPLHGLPAKDMEDEDYQTMRARVTSEIYKGIRENPYSEEDTRLLAKLVTHEAGGEGLNGWVAVAEVVLNRVNSGYYADTIEDVIYAPRQFSGVGAISAIEPQQEVVDTCRAVMEGKLSVLGNDNCLYFRNPMITSGIPSTQPMDWGTYPYYKAVGNHAFYLQSQGE